MIDTCNALASAIKVFLIISSEHDYLLPHELLVEELVEETASPWWSIGGCIQSEIPGSTQLIIYARPESRDVLRTQWACVQSAALAEHLAPGYGRYFLSLRGKRGLPGWAAFDGTALKRLRESGATEPYEYASALVAPGIVYNRISRFLAF